MKGDKNENSKIDYSDSRRLYAEESWNSQLPLKENNKASIESGIL